MNIFASNLLARREEKRFTQAYMAIHSNMSQPNYSDIERGKTNPSILQLKRFAEILETTMDDLMFDTTSPSQKGKENQNSVVFFENSVPMKNEDKDTYIRILENQLRNFWKNKSSQ